MALRKSGKEGWKCSGVEYPLWEDIMPDASWYSFIYLRSPSVMPVYRGGNGLQITCSGACRWEVETRLDQVRIFSILIVIPMLEC